MTTIDRKIKSTDRKMKKNDRKMTTIDTKNAKMTPNLTRLNFLKCSKSKKKDKQRVYTCNGTISSVTKGHPNKNTKCQKYITLEQTQKKNTKK